MVSDAQLRVRGKFFWGGRSYRGSLP